MPTDTDTSTESTTSPSQSTLDRLASLGEDMLGKAASNPAGARVLQGAMQVKERVDELSKRVRGLEAMEKRLADVEERVAKLESRKRATAKPEDSGDANP
jgi:DNA repair ATPase RecN